MQCTAAATVAEISKTFPPPQKNVTLNVWTFESNLGATLPTTGSRSFQALCMVDLYCCSYSVQLFVAEISEPWIHKPLYQTLRTCDSPFSHFWKQNISSPVQCTAAVSMKLLVAEISEPWIHKYHIPKPPVTLDPWIFESPLRPRHVFLEESPFWSCSWSSGPGSCPGRSCNQTVTLMQTDWATTTHAPFSF